MGVFFSDRQRQKHKKVASLLKKQTVLRAGGVKRQHPLVIDRAAKDKNVDLT